MLTGSREDTISEYFRVIKNAIHIDVEQSLETFSLDGDGEVVQIDESHVFSRKYNVGRTLVMTSHGWVFGAVEDNPQGRLFLQMVRERDADTLLSIIKNASSEEQPSSPMVGPHTLPLGVKGMFMTV